MRQLLSKVLFTLKLVFLSSSSWCYAIAVPADVSSYYSVDGQKFGTDQSEAVLATMNRVQATTYWFRCALPRPEIDPIHETTIFCFHGYPNQSYYDSDICKYIVWNYKIPSCPPKNANGQSYSSYTILSDANGTPSSSGQYCTKPCIAPFAFEGNQCVTYCPPGESLDLNLGRCVGNQSVIPEAKQYCGNPVVINDGEKVQHEEPDLASSGPFPLSFERAYYSRAVIDAESQSNTLLHSSLPDTEKAKWTRYVQPSDYEGPTVEWVTSTPIPQVIGDFPSVGHRQWLNNFNYYLATRGDGSVVVLLPNNEHLTFSAQSGNTYRLSAPSAVTLTRNLDSSGVVQSWTYRDAENMQYVFAPAGYLTQIIHPTGLSQWLSFDSTTGLLSSVRDDFGNQFTFTYANGLLTSVASNSGAQASYAYDQYGNLGTVTKPQPMAKPQPVSTTTKTPASPML
jgi:YD repeat-containing protein